MVKNRDSNKTTEVINAIYQKENMTGQIFGNSLLCFTAYVFYWFATIDKS